MLFVAKRTSTGRIPSSIKALRPKSDFWAISSQIWNVNCLHLEFVMLCWGLAEPRHVSTTVVNWHGQNTYFNHMTREGMIPLSIMIRCHGECWAMSVRRPSELKWTSSARWKSSKMSQRAGRLSDTSWLAWSGAAERSVANALMLACCASFESPFLKHTVHLMKGAKGPVGLHRDPCQGTTDTFFHYPSRTERGTVW